MRLFDKDSKAAIFVSGNDKGILRVASYLAQDIRNVTGCPVKAVRVVRTTDVTNGTAEECSLIITACIFGEPGFDVTVPDEIKTGREQFSLDYHEENGKLFITIVGSDKLGAEYGLLYISSLFGVSPWHYFGDAVT